MSDERARSFSASTASAADDGGGAIFFSLLPLVMFLSFYVLIFILTFDLLLQMVVWSGRRKEGSPKTFNDDSL